jgi:TonB family protein
MGIGGSRAKWSRYAVQVQSSIADALRRHPAIRTARLTAEIRIWADSNGRITRVTIARSTGDPALDSTLKAEALTGLQLPESPPKDMPMPITLSVSARRPN